MKETCPKGHPRKQIRLWKTPLQKIMTMGIITMSVR